MVFRLVVFIGFRGSSGTDKSINNGRLKEMALILLINFGLGEGWSVYSSIKTACFLI